MKYSDLIQTVEQSSPTEWKVIEAHAVSNWEYGTYSGEYRLIPNLHTSRAIYEPDIDIAILWGATAPEGENFSEPWTDEYTDPSASMVRVEILYKGNTIERKSAVYVDGNNFILPLPHFDSQKQKYEIQRSDLDMWRLLFHLYGHGGAASTIEGAFDIADVEVV